MDYEVIIHGVDSPDYFPGQGTSYTPFANVVTGIGDTDQDALIDALDQAVESGMDDRMADEIEKSTVLKSKIVASDHGEEMYWYISILWSRTEKNPRRRRRRGKR